MPTPLARLALLTAECRTADEYAAARLEWLQEVVDCDAIYQGAVSQERNYAPTVTGAEPEHTSACEANADRYWPDRSRLNRAAEAAGGIAIDLDVFDAYERDHSVFYREAMVPMKLQSTAIAIPRLRGVASSSIWLGRTGRGSRAARFRAPAALRILREALPVLALGDVLHGSTAVVASPPQPTPDLGLTRREQEVVGYLLRGLTNAEIARLCGTAHATVKNQVASILHKCGVANRTELVSVAYALATPAE